MMKNFTPGPWKATKRANKMIDIEHSFGDVKGAITLALCRVQARDSWAEEAEANANLIAAAPDLLAALREARAELFVLAETCNCSVDSIDQIDAAINKSVGIA